MERSLVLIKPDAMQRGLAGTVISRLERQGLKLVALWCRLYPCLSALCYFPGFSLTR